MSSNASKSHCVVRKKFRFTSVCASLEMSSELLPQTYTNNYGLTWVGRKRDFVNAPIYTYDRLDSVGHIMVDEPRLLSPDNTTIEATIDKQPWSKLYEKRCESEVYCSCWGKIA